MEKVKVLNTGENALPSESTPKSSAKDIRANVSLINRELIFNADIKTVHKTVKTGFLPDRYPDIVDTKSLVKALVILPGGRALIPSGLYMQLPEGHSMDVRPRSGLALKYGLEIVNSPGLIDEDYRGDVGIIVKNGGDRSIIIIDGERIAQIKLVKDVPFEWDSVTTKEELSDTVRGEGGFNSTGTK